MTNNKKIIIRADGNSDIGMGHFVRTLALGEMLQNDFYCVYATKSPSDQQRKEIYQVFDELIELPGDNSHFNSFLKYLEGDEIVVLDNYYFTTEYQKAIKARGCKLVCIDDMHDKHFVADVVINHALGIEPSAYDTEPYTQLFHGFKYALLRKEFRIQFEETKNKEFSCLIIMGGADPFGGTNHLLQLMTNINLPKPIAAVSPNKPNHKNAIWYKNLCASEISQLMEKAEFGILPASTVAIEACAKRLPFICGYIVENQINLYKGIDNEKIAICVDSYKALSENQLSIAIYKLLIPQNRKLIRKQQQKVIDDQIDKRFIKLFNNLWD